MSREEIIQEAINSILNCDEKGAVEVAQRALAMGLDPVAVLNDGFSEGIRQMGDLFGRGEKFLPQLIQSAEVMKTVTGILNEAMEGMDTGQKKGKIVIATVEGDVHDIGKSIVVSLLKTQGIEVFDLGRDVPVDKIINTALDVEADIIGTSALLTTTLTCQKQLEDELRKRDLRERFKTIVGGAPATQRWADKIGADAYAEDAGEAVEKVLGLLA